MQVKREYQVGYLTPAFLGNAVQIAQWRTPPFKSLLRQWWRVAWAAERKFDIDPDRMRLEEGRLFGHAGLKNDLDEKTGNALHARKSEVRLRLNRWENPTQEGVAPLPTSIDYGYAWFGLVKRGAGLRDRTAIRADDAKSSERCVLRISFPDVVTGQMDNAIRLMETFGQMGSRSRGGWGSVHFYDVVALSPRDLETYCRPLSDCLKTDWPMSLAKLDGKPLVWESKQSFADWVEVMKIAAKERRMVRESLKRIGGRDARFILGFADGKKRMPSPLRWKSVLDANGKLRLRVFALPHAIPESAGRHASDSVMYQAWSAVVETLTRSQGLQQV